VLAPASWTVPSHASAFTGLFPSQHGIEGYNEQRAKEASSKLAERPENIMKALSSDGYETYGFSCNPSISPEFGYPFKEFRMFDSDGDLELLRRILRTDKGRIGKEFLLIKNRMFSYLVNRGLRRTHSEKLVKRMLGSYPLEKGSRFCLEAIRSTNFRKPAFIFVNLMEAHERYDWNDFRGNWETYALDYVMGTPSTVYAHWQRRYPIHADFADNRLVRLIEIMKPLWGDSMIIVTSDHGQLLGEGGRYGHGYYLDDELLNVPFYMRVPDGGKQPEKGGGFMNLTMIPDVIKSALGWNEATPRSSITVSESLGPTRVGAKLMKFIRSRPPDEVAKFTRTFAHRVRVFSRKGSAVYNLSTDEVEETRGTMSKTEVSDSLERFAIKKFDVAIPPPPGEPVSQELVKVDEDVITKRLKDLGYE
jgi:hypothetical protein